MRDFKALKVWQKSHTLTLDVYRVTTRFPRHELYGLTSQTRRSSMSIPTNLAEGCGRLGQKELAYFLQLAIGSAKKLEYQLLLAKDLGLLEANVHQGLDERTCEVRKMLTAFLIKVSREDRVQVR